MLLNLSPLARYREFRLLFVGQLVSFLGTMITYVAVPYQVYELTRSSLTVGLLGTVQLVPLLVFGLVGGTLADSMDRRKLLLLSEAFLCVGTAALAWNASLERPSVEAIFAITALMQAANGFHRPAMDALTQKLVEPRDYGAVAALGSLRYSVGSILGPALGGVIIASGGIAFAYWVDLATFLVAIAAVALMRPIPPAAEAPAFRWNGVAEGLSYALKRPELVGTYIVDIVAMTFAFPTALFPAMAEGWGGAKAAGALFSAMSAGTLVMTVFSGWTARVRRHGAAVVLAAGAWGAAILALGFAPNLPVALACLAVAGAADMMSGLFRGIIWNETIPNEMRGRLSGVEMISYMSGPLLGNARAGWVAAITSTRMSISSGGVLCVLGVVLCAFALPRFWAYRSAARPEVLSPT